MRSSSVQGIDLIGDTTRKSLLPLSGSFVEEASGSKRKIASIAIRTVGNVSQETYCMLWDFWVHVKKT